MSRVREAFVRRREQGHSALVVYVTQGDPSPAESVDIVVQAAAAGADVIELGVPFSDPNADGVVIQEGMQRALAAGGGLQSSLDTVREIRRRGCDVPIVLFGYYNPIFIRGVDRFGAEAAAAGVDAVLVVDTPVDEIDEVRTPLAPHGLEVVPLVAPTSGLDRVARVKELDPPFVYYISLTGVTGAAFRGRDEVAKRVAQVREASGVPVAVGFGIANAEDARTVGGFADGAVVGSAVVRRIKEAGAGKSAAAVAGFVSELRGALGQ
jgi:tryptophan synthase alpha chain